MSHASFKVVYPKDGAVIKCRLPAFFVAFGRARASLKSLTAALTDRHGRPVGAVKMLKPPPHWAIRVTEIPRAGTYTLSLINFATGHVLDSRKVKVQGVHAIGITYPASNDYVCPYFVAFGTTD